MSAEITVWLDEAQAKVDAATEGPWELAPWNGLVTLGAPYFDPDGEPDQLIVSTAGNRRTDAAFIADARTRLPQAIAALRAALAEADASDELAAQSEKLDFDPTQSGMATALRLAARGIRGSIAAALGVHP